MLKHSEYRHWLKQIGTYYIYIIILCIIIKLYILSIEHIQYTLYIYIEDIVTYTDIVYLIL